MAAAAEAANTRNRNILWEKLVEIRPGRSLFYRREDISSKVFVASNDLAASVSPQGTCYNVVFLHGTCASLTQFLLVLDSLASLLLSNEKKESITLQCHLYDAMGCGQSSVSRRWKDYHVKEAVEDLYALLQNFVDESPTFVVAHSFAPNVVLRCFDAYSSSLQKVRGCLFMCTAMNGSPKAIGDGGHWVFRLPVFVLECLQESLTASFIKRAYHPETDLTKLDAVTSNNNRNEMSAVQAIHRNLQWTTVEQSQAFVQLEIPTMILHGEADGILSVECGQFVADVVRAQGFRIVPKASHQVMEEQPDEVAQQVLQLTRQ